jgi:stage V sporulation protein G
MNITDVKIRFINQDKSSNMLAVLSITIDNMFAVHDIKIVRGTERIFVAMPCRKDENGTFHDIVHPINFDARKLIEEVVLDAYNTYIKNLEEKASETETAAEIA